MVNLVYKKTSFVRLCLVWMFILLSRQQGSSGRVFHVQWNIVWLCQLSLDIREREDCQVSPTFPHLRLQVCALVCSQSFQFLL